MASGSADDPKNYLAYTKEAPKDPTSLATTGITLGLLGIPCNIAFLMGGVMGVAAIFIGILVVQRVNRAEGVLPPRAKTLGITSIVLGTIAVLIGMGCGILMMTG